VNAKEDLPSSAHVAADDISGLKSNHRSTTRNEFMTMTRDSAWSRFWASQRSSIS
jgi:hypothetical protein